MEVEWSGYCEVGFVGGADVEFLEECGVVSAHVADGGGGRIVDAGSGGGYLVWWHRWKRAYSSSQGLGGGGGTW